MGESWKFQKSWPLEISKLKNLQHAYQINNFKFVNGFLTLCILLDFPIDTYWLNKYGIAHFEF